MTRLAALLALPLLVWSVMAQVDLDLTMDRQIFLPSEDTEVAVRISNFTGEPLTLGQEPRWIHFTVEDLRGRVAGKLQDPPDTGEFTLEPATRGKLRFNITPMFNITTPGSYRIFASIRLPTGEEVTSDPHTFEIISGVKLSEPREVGFRNAEGQLERRKFVLQRASFPNKRVQLYARLTDSTESHTIKVIPLGNTVSFDRPEWLVDRESHFHVLHRTDSAHYFYHVLAPDGSLTFRQLWLADGTSRVELRVNEEGEVRVFGAVRRPYPGELPKPSVAALSTNRVAEVQSPTTNTNEVSAPKQP
ncbi:MAG: hypothetical protein J0M24_13205 [Verrucomicrobia bacterium]|nr:hypothetical protein [Verrucomicrobiota bacterium]